MSDARSTSEDAGPDGGGDGGSASPAGASSIEFDVRWSLYTAYVLTFLGGANAFYFALESREWSVGPVALAWLLLCLWHWLYGVGVRYRRPFLRYFSAMVDLAFGCMLAAFALERAEPQWGATSEGAVLRGTVTSLIWTAVATGASTGLILMDALIFSRFRSSTS